jgi:hypothetical protein
MAPILIFYMIIPFIWGAAISEYPGRVDVLTGLVAAALEVALVIAGLRSGIGVDADGVTVRNLLGRSRHVPWDEVIRFDTMLQEGARYGAATNFVTVVCRRRCPPGAAPSCCGGSAAATRVRRWTRGWTRC